MAKHPKKKKLLRIRHRSLPKQNFRGPSALVFPIAAGRGVALFEIKRKLFMAPFLEPGSLKAFDCKNHAISIGLNFCTGIIAETNSARPDQPRAIVIHLPPKQRAYDYRGPFKDARKAVVDLLKAMPNPARIELVGGGRDKAEQKIIREELLKKGIKPIINPNHVGGKDPKRWVELRPQEGKPTVFDYSSNYVMKIREYMRNKGLAKGLLGKELAAYIANGTNQARQAFNERRTDGDKPFFK